MSKKYRKVLAAILAATMVLGSGVVANASESTDPSGSGSGTGGVDVVKGSDVFQVILPTSSGTTFNYILNPTGVIAETDHVKYASASFTNDGNDKIYFKWKPASGSTVSTYSNVSEEIKAYNKSNVDVEIEVTAKLATQSTATNSVIQIATSSVAADTDSARKMSLRLLSGKDDPTGTGITEDGITATASIASASGSYKTQVVNGEYKMALIATAANAKTDAELDLYFKSYSFRLTGDCNSTKEWEKLDVAPPTVSLVWTIAKPEGTVEADESGPKITVNSTGLVTMSGLTADKNYKSAVITDLDGVDYLITESDGTWIGDGSTWNNKDGGTLSVQLNNAWVSALKGGTGKITLTLTDNTDISAEIKIP